MPFKRTLNLVAILAVLSGCTLVDDLTSMTRSDNTPVAVQPAPRKPPPPADTGTAPPVRNQGSVALLDPKRLVGLGEAQVAKEIGRPQQVRQEGTATIWRYAVDTCRMDVFFYADLATGERHVLTYEIDAGSGNKEGKAVERCLRIIQSASRRKG